MGNKSTPVSCGGGLDFFGALTIAFIILKLCDVITWAWVWVLAPIWIPLAIVAVACLIAAAVS